MGDKQKIRISTFLAEAAQEAVDSHPKTTEEQIEQWIRVGKRTCSCLTEDETTQFLFGVASVKYVEKQDVTLPSTSSVTANNGGGEPFDQMSSDLQVFFDNDEDMLQEWLTTPLPILNGKCPLKLLWSSSGRAELSNLLLAMRCGEMA